MRTHFSEDPQDMCFERSGLDPKELHHWPKGMIVIMQPMIVAYKYLMNEGTHKFTEAHKLTYLAL